jgi:bacterioferritin (cytochrome b1)
MSTFKSEKDREEIVEALQLNMNEEINATLQYVCHRISAKALSAVIAESFKSAALDEMSHILYFSDLVEKYGGTPHFQEWQIDKSGELTTMLEADIQLEKKAKERYRKQLDRFKDYPELTVIIDSVLSDENDHEEVFTRYLYRSQGRCA